MRRLRGRLWSRRSRTVFNQAGTRFASFQSVEHDARCEMLAEATTAAQSTRTEVLTALHQASIATGSDFSYLLDTAMRESSLKPSAKSNSSSASGLFQFVEQTWLGLVKQFGAEYGLGSYADAIGKGADGRYTVAGKADRQAILALRNDPKVAALMAGEYTNQTRSQLESRLGRDISSGELYAAHFMGPCAACRLIELSGATPSASAAAAFPAAAEANRGVFYRPDGSPKTVREVYAWTLKQQDIPKGSAAALEAIPDSSRAQFATSHARKASPAAPEPNDPRTGYWPLFSPYTGTNSGTVFTAAAAFPQLPFVLTPGVVDLLASLSPGGSSQDSDDSKTF